MKASETVIGKIAVITLPTSGGNCFDVNVRIDGVKFAYGNLRYQVTPVSGTGSKSRVQILEEKGDGQ